MRIPANPLLEVLRGRVDANLSKLRAGLTIAGVPRPVPAPAAGTSGLVLPSGDGLSPPPSRPPLPTPYRYSTLVARARTAARLGEPDREQLSGRSGWRGRRGLHRAARQQRPRALGRQGQPAARLRGRAAAEVTAARLQVNRAADNVDVLTGGSPAGRTSGRGTSSTASSRSRTGRTRSRSRTVSWRWLGRGVADLSSKGLVPLVALASAGGALASAGLAAEEQRSQESALRASFERRRQEWALQQMLGRDDLALSNQNLAIAKARAGLAGREVELAEMGQRHAQAAVSYLGGRRLNAEMYAWMAGELADVYRYLLRQATSVAQLAEQQLSFERQQAAPAIVQSNYWAAGTSADGTAGPDRRGLTGSARLLRDLTELDQYAFETNRRKLNLEHVFSLSMAAPEAFAEFRRTGVLAFSTPMAEFDRRFPGHLLRSIRRVRLSVLALVSPTQGIAASLTCSGQSRVVVQTGGAFSTVTFTRPPETVAFTGSANATGTFELDPQPELKNWFEGHGTDTTWEFRMPKPANSVDYDSIADISVVVEYTALYDADYERVARSSLPTRVRGTLPVSIRRDVLDSWYSLATEDPTDPGKIPVVRLPVTAADFPRNHERVRLEAVALLVVRGDGAPAGGDGLPVAHLDLVRGDRRLRGGAATAVGDVISTRLGSGAAWGPLTDPPDFVAPEAGGEATAWDRSPTGDWELAIEQDPTTREQLSSGAIEDIVLLLSYRADLPSWPS